MLHAKRHYVHEWKLLMAEKAVTCWALSNGNDLTSLYLLFDTYLYRYTRVHQNVILLYWPLSPARLGWNSSHYALYPIITSSKFSVPLSLSFRFLPATLQFPSSEAVLPLPFSTHTLPSVLQTLLTSGMNDKLYRAALPSWTRARSYVLIGFCFQLLFSMFLCYGSLH